MTNSKRIVAILIIVACFFASFAGFNMKVEAAQKTKVIITTQECSIWTQPNTSEQYRQKKIPAGWQVTIYTDVVQSTKGDGKTFYKTVKGAYILCRCCDGNEATTGTNVKKNYKTPYTTSNVSVSAGTCNGKKCYWYTSLYKEAPAYVGITFYVKEESKATIRRSEKCIIGKGLPVRVWGYTEDGYYICSREWDDGVMTSFIEKSKLTESTPDKLYDFSKMVTSKTKIDPDTLDYHKNTSQLWIVPTDCYYDYLVSNGVNSYSPSGLQFFGEQDYKSSLETVTNKRVIEDYVHLIFEGRSYEDNVQRIKVELDEAYLYNPNANSYGFSVNAKEFTKSQFYSMQAEIYQYAVSKYGFAKIGYGNSSGTITWCSNPAGGGCRFWGMGGDEYLSCVIAFK